MTLIAFSQAIRHAVRGVVAHAVGTRDAADLRPDPLCQAEQNTVSTENSDS